MPNHRLVLLLAGTLLVGACTMPALTVPTGKKPATSEKQTKPSESPAASPTPSAGASPTPGPTPTPTPTPQPTGTPSVPTHLLSGLVKIDAGYVIAAGGGNIIAAGGGNIIAAGGGNVIAAGGGNVIAAGGGNVIAAGGGNIIAAGGGNILAGGTSLYRTLAEAAPEPGTMLPVKGMLVVPLSLKTGLPLGPAVYTDETGGYKVTVPEGTEDNVLIYASIPGTSEADPRLKDRRLRYAAIVPGGTTTSVTIDEDVTLQTKFALTIFTERLAEIFSIKTEPEFDAFMGRAFSGGALSDIGPFRDTLQKGMKGLYQKSVAAKLPDLSPAARQAVAQRVADAMVGAIPLETIKPEATFYSLSGYDYGDSWQATKAAFDTTKPAVAHMKDAFVFMRAQAAAYQKRTGKLPDGTYVARDGSTRNFLQDGPRKYTLSRPSDFGDFVLREYLAANNIDSALPSMRTVLDVIEATVLPNTTYTQAVIRAVNVTVLLNLILKVENDGVQKNIDAAIESAKNIQLP